LHRYTAHFDEAGEEGVGQIAAGPLGGQSRWLILDVCFQGTSQLPIGAALTFSHKVPIPESKYEEMFKNKGYLYTYFLDGA
jgi:hypothetical protein